MQKEFLELGKRYGGRHFWAIGYGVWSTGNITDKMMAEYLEHHRKPSNADTDNIILEQEFHSLPFSDPALKVQSGLVLFLY